MLSFSQSSNGNEDMAMQVQRHFQSLLANYATGKGSSDLNREDMRGQFNNSKKKGKKRLCTYCNWDNHTRETCYKLLGYLLGHIQRWTRKCEK